MILALSLWTLLPTLGAAVGYLALGTASHRWTLRNSRLFLVLLWWLHGVALVTALGPMPVHFGFAPALSVTVWLVYTVYASETVRYPQLQANARLCLLAALGVLLPLGFPGTPYHSAHSPWLPLHWTLGIASYGLLGAAVVHAVMMQSAERRMRSLQTNTTALPLLALERLTFRFVWLAFALLTLTLAAGWWFAEQLHPGGWQWSHKAVFTTLSWVVLAVLLWGRWRRGWRGRLATRMLYAAAVLLMLGYVGSRFVLEVVLHRV